MSSIFLAASSFAGWERPAWLSAFFPSMPATSSAITPVWPSDATPVRNLPPSPPRYSPTSNFLFLSPPKPLTPNSPGRFHSPLETLSATSFWYCSYSARALALSCRRRISSSKNALSSSDENPPLAIISFQRRRFSFGLMNGLGILCPPYITMLKGVVGRFIT